MTKRFNHVKPDEIFGGYPWYHNKNILYNECFPWSQSTGLRAALLKPGVLKKLNPVDFVQREYEATVAQTLYNDFDTPLNRRMREMFVLNVKWFMQTLLEGNVAEVNHKVAVKFLAYLDKI